MRKKLAIKGHSTRGKEVIELLEMMGGTNPFTINNGAVIGNKETSCYYISEDIAKGYISWDYIGPEEINKYKIFTLEEFLEKYPYKVGDKVMDGYGDSLTIKSMRWSTDCETMVYDFEDSVIVLAAEDLLEYNNLIYKRTHEDVIFDSIIWHLRNSINNGKQNLSGGECEEYFREVVKKNNENKMKNVLAELLEHIKTTSKEDLEREFEEIEEWSNVGPTVDEFMDFCDKVNKKPKYPTTYEECFNEYTTHSTSCLLADKTDVLYNLLICRNAYWKIAGEEMGLGKSWEPKFGKTVLFDISFYLYQDSFVLHKGEYSCSDNCLLVFPTKEMRDAFYENFKDFIEQCKELL